MLREQVIDEMKYIFRNADYGIKHTMKVLKHAERIATLENLSAIQKMVVSLASILHDIGAISALEKYGNMSGKNQEAEGPPIARKILEDLCVPTEVVDKICYIIGHHHTFDSINSIEFQIVWEADLLENLKAMEIRNDINQVLKIINEQFKTKAGTEIATRLYISSVDDSGEIKRNDE